MTTTQPNSCLSEKYDESNGSVIEYDLNRASEFISSGLHHESHSAHPRRHCRS